MRRLYSTFAQGLPGLGLLLIRLAIGASACAHGIEVLGAGAWSVHLFALLPVGLGVLVIIGLSTPVAAALLALLAAAAAYTQPDQRWDWVFSGTIAATVALIGPGRWSVDARLFGWKEIEIPVRRPAKPPF